MTGRETWWPLATSYTTTPLPDACRAALGTVSALVNCRTMIDTCALAPAYRPGGLPVTAMLTA